MSDYAIGSADSFGVVTVMGVDTVEFDLMQAQDEKVARYELHLSDERIQYHEVEIGVGESIPRRIAQDVMYELPSGGVFGFVVPDHLLATFIKAYPDKEIYRQR